jgi:hypothetical protein
LPGAGTADFGLDFFFRAFVGLDFCSTFLPIGIARSTAEGPQQHLLELANPEGRQPSD